VTNIIISISLQSLIQDAIRIYITRDNYSVLFLSPYLFLRKEESKVFPRHMGKYGGAISVSIALSSQLTLRG